MSSTQAIKGGSVTKGGRYTVRQLDTRRMPLLQADLRSRGWDGETYELTGVRGAHHMAYRSARTGELHIAL